MYRYYSVEEQLGAFVWHGIDTAETRTEAVRKAKAHASARAAVLGVRPKCRVVEIRNREVWRG